MPGAGTPRRRVALGSPTTRLQPLLQIAALGGQGHFAVLNQDPENDFGVHAAKPIDLTLHDVGEAIEADRMLARFMTRLGKPVEQFLQLRFLARRLPKRGDVDNVVATLSRF